MDLLQKILSTVCIATAAMGIQTAQATTSASVTIDNFAINYIDLSGGSNAPSLTWTSQQGEASSYATTFTPFDEQSDSQSASDFSTSLTTNTSTARAQSGSIRGPGFLQANSASEPGGSGGPSDSNWADSSSWNSGAFEFTGYGLAIISMDWSVELNGELGNGNDYSFASMYFSGSFSDNFWNSGGADYDPELYSYNSGDFSNNGSFAWAIFSDGQHIVYGEIEAEAYVSSNSPASEVPVPTAAWLFGSSLLSLIGISRRKISAA